MKCLFDRHILPPPRIRLRRRRKGAGFLLPAIVSAGVVALTSLGVTKLNQAAFGGYNSSRIMLQAQQYAEAEAAVVKATAYDDLTARSRVEIQNSNGYFSQIMLSEESDYTESIKQRIVSINIYRGNEALPRYSLNVLKTDAEIESSGGGVPVGTIIAWASSTAPTEGGTWLLCNGQSCSAYPKLSVLIGNNVPNLDARFLEGTINSPGTAKDAGLPNIKGSANQVYVYPGSVSSYASGAISWGSAGVRWGGGGGDYYKYTLNFDASKYDSIYGKSSTVQPKSYTVRYYIKAD